MLMDACVGCGNVFSRGLGKANLREEIHLGM